MAVGGRVFPCALGRSGTGIAKREGDGKTPLGRFALLSAMIRHDRVGPRSARLPLKRIRAGSGWCDAPGHRRYNRPVDLPFTASHEKLKRDDHLYDCLVVMDYNITCRLSCGGSAIFFHLAKPDYGPTEGCVAIARSHMLRLWPHLTGATTITVR